MNTSNTSSAQNLEPWQEQLNLRLSKFSEITGLNLEKVKEVFRELGVHEGKEVSLTLLDDGELLTMSDLFEKFVDSKLIDKPTLRLAITHLRAKTRVPSIDLSSCEDETKYSGLKEIINSLKPKEQWTDEQLLQNYSENDPDIASILSKRSNGRPFIVFNKDDTIDMVVSLGLLGIAKRQPTNDIHTVNGSLRKVYRAGKYPLKALEESPFIPCKPLVNGFCSDTTTDWNGISHECRVMAAIQARVVDKSKFSHSDYYDAIYQAALLGFDKMRGKYKKAAMIYDELHAQDQLPKLRFYPVSSNRVDTGF